MKSNPKVSIIIPVYNGSNYLSEAIDSALAQTYNNIEIIVVNDGSGDNGATEKTALKYGSKIIYFSKPNGGVASALNMGIEKMNGEFFSWLSHDDLYYPDKVEKSLKYIRKENQIAYSDFEQVDEKLRFLKSYRLKGMKNEKFMEYLLKHSILHGCSLLIPKEAFLINGTFNEKLITVQDYEMWFRLLKNYEFVHVPKVLVKSRTHEEQGSRILVDKHSGEKNKLFIWVSRFFDSEFYLKYLKTVPPWHYLKLFLYYRYRGFNEAAETVIGYFSEECSDFPEINVFRENVEKIIDGKPFLKKYIHELYFKIGVLLKSGGNELCSKYFDYGLLLYAKSKQASLFEVQKAASFLKSVGRHDDALRLFNRILKKTKDLNLIGSSAFHAGEIYYLKAQKHKAEEYFNLCIQNIPGHGKAKEYLTLLLKSENN